MNRASQIKESYPWLVRIRRDSKRRKHVTKHKTYRYEDNWTGCRTDAEASHLSKIPENDLNPQNSAPVFQVCTPEEASRIDAFERRQVNPAGTPNAPAPAPQAGSGDEPANVRSAELRKAAAEARRAEAEAARAEAEAAKMIADAEKTQAEAAEAAAKAAAAQQYELAKNEPEVTVDNVVDIGTEPPPPDEEGPAPSPSKRGGRSKRSKS